jgi:hypothetical protein
MNRRRLCALALIWLLAPLALGGCKAREPYAGKYQSVNQQPPITLELKTNGEGLWTMGAQQVAFRWEVKKERIWIHTKGGGVLIAMPEGDSLALDLSGDFHPGCPIPIGVTFKRLPEGG